MTSERNQRATEGDSDVPTVDELVGIVSFDSPSDAKEAAKRFVQRYDEAVGEPARDAFETAVKRSSLKAAEHDKRKIARIYQKAAEFIELRKFFHELAVQYPPPEEEVLAIEWDELNEDEQETGIEDSFESEEKEPVEGDFFEQCEGGSIEGDGTDASEGGERTFYSTYHEYVSHRMSDFSDAERRSGEALKQIAKEWKAIKEGESVPPNDDVEGGVEEV